MSARSAAAPDASGGFRICGCSRRRRERASPGAARDALDRGDARAVLAPRVRDERLGDRLAQVRLHRTNPATLAAAADAADAASGESTNPPYVAAELNATAASRTRAASSQAALAAADDAADISPRSSGLKESGS